MNRIVSFMRTCPTATQLRRPIHSASTCLLISLILLCGGITNSYAKSKTHKSSSSHSESSEASGTRQNLFDGTWVGTLNYGGPGNTSVRITVYGSGTSVNWTSEVDSGLWGPQTSEQHGLSIKVEGTTAKWGTPNRGDGVWTLTPTSDRNSAVVTFTANGLFGVNASATFQRVVSPSSISSSEITGTARKSKKGETSGTNELRIIVSETTKASLKSMSDFNRKVRTWNFGMMKGDLPSESEVMDKLNQTLSPFFRTGGSKGGLTMTFDFRATIPSHSSEKSIAQVSGTFRDSSGKVIQTISGEGTSTMPFPAYKTDFPAALTTAFNEFANNLRSSAKLIVAGNASKASQAEVSGEEIAAKSFSRKSKGYSESNASLESSYGIALDKAEAMLEGKSDGAQNKPPTGIYAIEKDYTFNVLDSVYYDPSKEQLSLIGHFDNRFSKRKIPYLQHLATLLENTEPEFSLAWTSDSEKRIEELFVRHISQSESDSINNAAWRDKGGNLTKVGRYMLPALGVSPVFGNRRPGSMGVEAVGEPKTLFVRISKVIPGSGAATAGLQVGDIITVTNGRPPFSPEEFERYIRLCGAGDGVPVTYMRNSQRRGTVVPLDASDDHNVWRGATDFYSLLQALYFAAGNSKAGQVVEMLGAKERAQEKYHAPEEVTNDMNHTIWYTLGLSADVRAANEAVKSGHDSEALRLDFIGKFLRALEETLRFDGTSVTDAFTQARRRGDGGAVSIAVGMAEFNRQMERKAKALLNPIFERPEGLQIPPELVEDQFHIHPEMVPQYLGVDKHSLLARAMFSSDYLCKRLMDRPELKQAIPSYQTGFEFEVKHPEFRHTTGNYRIWLSVDKMDTPQSPDGKTLAFRDVKMRFNIRDESGRASDGSGKDLPNKPGNYEELLTSLWDNFEQEYPTLHELRESAKVAVAAKWILSQNPAAKLPKEGRVSWQGPAKIPGLVFFEMTPDSSRATKTKVIIIANGGVSIRSDSSVVTDSSVVDLRGSSGFVALLGAPNDTLVRASSSGTGQGNAYGASWVSTINWDGKEEQAVVVVGKLPGTKSADVGGTKNGEMRDAVAEKTAGGNAVIPSTASDLNIQEKDLLAKLTQAHTNEEKAVLEVQLSHIRAAQGDVRGASDAWTQALKDNADATYKAEHDFQAAKHAAEKAAFFPGSGPPSTRNPNGPGDTVTNSTAANGLPSQITPYLWPTTNAAGSPLNPEEVKASGESEFERIVKEPGIDSSGLRRLPQLPQLPQPQPLFKTQPNAEDQKKLADYFTKHPEIKEQLEENNKHREDRNKKYEEALKTGHPDAAAEIKLEAQKQDQNDHDDLKKKLEKDPDFPKLHVEL